MTAKKKNSGMVVPVMIEIQKGCRNKYEYDKKKRSLNSTVCFFISALPERLASYPRPLHATETRSTPL